MIKKKIKVGTITFHRAENFGAVLQAYALQKFLLNKNYDTEIIDFVHKLIVDKYNLIFTDNLILAKNNPKRYAKIVISNLINLPSRYIKKSNYNKFKEEHLNVSNRKYYRCSELEDNLNTYDYLLTGSDQVWNDEFSNGEGKAYFLDFHTDAKKVSYAASTGGKDISESDINKINKLDSISVREKSTAEFLCRKINKGVTVVCDPVFLLTQGEWEYLLKNCINKERKLPQKYIFVYNIWTDNRLVDLVNSISSELNTPIICYNKSKQFNRAVMSIQQEKPEFFLQVLKNADYIISSSFHGTAFSLIFNKDFITYAHPKTGKRMENLLETFNLSDRLIDLDSKVNNNVKLIKTKIEYNSINEIIKTEKFKASQFLSKALGENT